MKEPFVSVIMPVYNSGHFIPEAIESILSQSYYMFEFIIINDGSFDDSIDIIKRYDDTRIKLINHSTNRGNYVCRNEGCRIARGKYICVMDADDIAFPERIRTQVELMEKDRSLLACGTYFKFINGNICIKPKNYSFIKLSLLSNNVLLHPSLIIRRETIESVGYYDEKYNYSSDYDLVCKIASKGKITNIPEVLMKYRVHEKQISTARKSKQTDYANQIRLNYLRNYGFDLPSREEEYFTKLMTNTKMSNADIEYFEQFINKMEEQNNQLKIFEKQQLSRFLNLAFSKCYING